MKIFFDFANGCLTAAILALCLSGCGNDDVTNSSGTDRSGIVGQWVQVTPDFQASAYVFTAGSQFTYAGGGFALAPDDKLWSEGTFVFDNDSLTLQSGAVVLRDVAVINDLDMLQLSEGSSARMFARADPLTADKNAVAGVYDAHFTIRNPGVYQFTVGEVHSGTLTIALNGAQPTIAIYSQDFIILEDNPLLLFRVEQGPVVRRLFAALGFLDGGNAQIGAKPILMMGEFTSSSVTGILKFRSPLGLTEEFTCEVTGQKRL
ncbi:MAG: hypothetical protein OEW00_07015 [candidate division Zixibacteria bacterium]|nr:hypothetical protein [candidate division Zixibacteria bacterium]